MKVSVLTTDERTVSLDVEPDELVENLKATLEVETSIPLSQQQILYHGKEILNNGRLNAAGVVENDLLMLVTGAPSAPNRPGPSPTANALGLNTDGSAVNLMQLMLKKAGTPKRKDVIYIAPGVEEIKNKKQLDKYLKVHPGEPSSADLDWSTGKTPRRSARLSSKVRRSSDSTDAEPVTKRSRRSLEDSKVVRSPGSKTTPSRKGRKSQRLADTPGQDEILQEAAKEQDEGSAVPSNVSETNTPMEEGEKGDEVRVEDGARAASGGKDSKEAILVTEVESTGQPTSQLGSSEETGGVAVKVIAEETPTEEGEKVDEVRVEDGARAASAGKDSKEAMAVTEVELTGQPTSQLGSSEEAGGVAVKVIAEETPMEEGEKGDEVRVEDGARAASAGKDSEEAIAVTEVESTGQPTSQLDSSKEAEGVAVKVIAEETPLEEGERGDEVRVEDGARAASAGKDSEEAIAVTEVGSTGQPTSQLGSSEEAGGVAVKVIAEEQVLTAQGTDTDTVMKGTATFIEAEKVETTVLEVVIPEVGDPLETSAVDAVDEVTKFPEAETSLKEENLEVEKTLDVPQNLEGEELDNPLVNCAIKDEDSLKPKDHLEPQGIHALIEEPDLCGSNKPDQTTESPFPAADGLA